MRRIFFAIAWSFAVVAAFTACSKNFSTSTQAQRTPTRADTTMDYASLVDALRTAGASVEAAGEVDQPFLSVSGQMIKVYGEDVQVFEYSGPTVMEAEAAKISRDGNTVGTSKIHWIGSPHFFRRGKLLVLYMGDSENVLKTLQTTLGPQFAGQ